jgi:Nucleotide modification associated domain 3
MKIILSRKGFDGSAGGCPSPIFEDGSMISLPIPASGRFGRDYTSINSPRKEFSHLGQLIGQLRSGKAGKLSKAHLDPDLRKASLNSRPQGWRGIFGQSFISEGHLSHHCVGEGDLFLFFGLFKEVSLNGGTKVSYVRGKSKHVIWGWLKVEKKYRLPDNTQRRVIPVAPDWAMYHPHVEFWKNEKKPNAIYVAADRLTPTSDTPGWGVFPKYREELRLSCQSPANAKRLVSLWQLPLWMYPWKEGGGERTALSHHGDKKRWTCLDGHVTLQSVGRGQEFVLDSEQYPEAQQWAEHLIESRIR